MPNDSLGSSSRRNGPGRNHLCLHQSPPQGTFHTDVSHFPHLRPRPHRRTVIYAEKDDEYDRVAEEKERSRAVDSQIPVENPSMGIDGEELEYMDVPTTNDSNEDTLAASPVEFDGVSIGDENGFG
ncbi:hypothetical protein PQX77_004302 [Marasmius sp. AFHP31]|nr:hypothetical protein PQX77_004302 [Marasmius sp. AFHP31]